MDRLLAIRQRVDTAHRSPDIVSRLGASIEGLYPPKRAPSFAYKALSRSPPSLEHLFPHAQLVYPPPLLFLSDRCLGVPRGTQWRQCAYVGHYYLANIHVLKEFHPP
jgi:hypothetical protein